MLGVGCDGKNLDEAEDGAPLLAFAGLTAGRIGTGFEARGDEAMGTDLLALLIGGFCVGPLLLSDVLGRTSLGCLNGEGKGAEEDFGVDSEGSTKVRPPIIVVVDPETFGVEVTDVVVDA